MAGHQLQHTSTRTTKSPAYLSVATPFLRLFGREVATIEINGTKFSAVVPEGTKFEQALDRIIEKYGGGVATLKYEGMEGKEIVAVRVGDQLMVKGEPDKIAKADFSSFGEHAEAAKAIAIEEARNSHGGIHFFIGSSGIPIVVGNDGQVFFPNGGEVEINRNTSVFSIRLVDYNKDANSLSDLGNGALSISPSAQQLINHELDKDEITKSHGGIRGDKFMLEESKLLIYDILGDRVSTASEYADKFQVCGFKAPQFDPILIQQLPITAPFTNFGLVYPTTNQPIQVPMDGSIIRVPYLFVSIFDGKIQDAMRAKSSKILMNAVRQTGEQITSGQAQVNQSKDRPVVFVPYEGLNPLNKAPEQTKILARTGVRLMVSRLFSPTAKDDKSDTKQAPSITLGSFAHPRLTINSDTTSPSTKVACFERQINLWPMDHRTSAGRNVQDSPKVLAKQKQPRLKKSTLQSPKLETKPKKRRKDKIRAIDKIKKEETQRKPRVKPKVKQLPLEPKKQITKPTRSKKPSSLVNQMDRTVRKPKTAKPITKPKAESEAVTKPKQRKPKAIIAKDKHDHAKVRAKKSGQTVQDEPKSQKKPKQAKIEHFRKKEEIKKSKQKPEEAIHTRSVARKRSAVATAKREEKKRKVDRYFLMDMLGMLKRKRKINGRAMARN